MNRSSDYKRLSFIYIFLGMGVLRRVMLFLIGSKGEECFKKGFEKERVFLYEFESFGFVLMSRDGDGDGK